MLHFKYRDTYKTIDVFAVNYSEAKRLIESKISSPAYAFRMTVEHNGKFIPV